METDRGAVLTVRAAVRGVIDFSKARLLDPHWWRRSSILIKAVGADDDERLLRDIFNFHLALVSNSGLTDESFAKEQSKARDAFYDITGAIRPWEGVSAEARKAKEIKDLRQQYIAVFGDPSDPVVAAKLHKDIAEMMEAREKLLAVESDMDRITRLKAERLAKLAAGNRQGRR